MPISFHCETCRRSIRVPDGSEGKKTRCPGCYSIIQVPFFDRGTVDPVGGPLDEDPLGIKDPGNAIAPSEYAETQRDNPFASTSERSSQEPSINDPVSRLSDANRQSYQWLRLSLVLCTATVMTACLFTSVCVMVVGIQRVLEYAEGQASVQVLYEFIGHIPLVLLQLATLISLNEARRLGNYRLAWMGLGMSLIPCANYSVCLIVPIPLILWSMYVANRPEIKQSFQSEINAGTPE